MSNKVDGLSNDEITVYKHKNGRLMVYIKETKQVISYPRYIMEKELGRKLLPTEQVHHKDGNFLNNDIDNLEVLTNEEHFKLHAQQKEKYHDKMMICPQCGKPFLWTAHQQQKFYSNASRKKLKNRTYLGKPLCSKKCVGAYGNQVQTEMRNK